MGPSAAPSRQPPHRHARAEDRTTVRPREQAGTHEPRRKCIMETRMGSRLRGNDAEERRAPVGVSRITAS